MADQPDWQRFQSSNSPPLWNVNPSAGLTSPILFVGPWRSLFMYAFTNGGTGIWTIDTAWSSDKTFTDIGFVPRTVVGNSVPRIGWVPTVGQWVQFTVALSHASVGDAIDILVSGSLLDVLQLQRAFPDPLIQQTQQLLNHNNFVDLDCARSAPGDGLLTIRSTGYDTAFDLKQINQDGTTTALLRYEVAAPNESRTYPVTLLDHPMRLTVTNFDPNAQVKYDAMLVLT